MFTYFFHGYGGTGTGANKIVQLKLHNHVLHFSQVLEDLEVEDDLDQLDSLQLLQILQKVPANQIVQRNGLFEEFMFALVPWKPIVDGNHASKPFIPDDPRHSI